MPTTLPPGRPVPVAEPVAPAQRVETPQEHIRNALTMLQLAHVNDRVVTELNPDEYDAIHRRLTVAVLQLEGRA